MKIKNIEASTLYEFNKGIRTQYKYTEAMFTNSLFYDFLIENGLNYGKSFTRDIICLEFNFGTRSYEEEMTHLKKILKNAKKKEDEDKVKRIKEIFEFVKENKEEYVKISKEDLRIKLYQEGINIEYKITSKRGKIKECQNIHYKMLYRSTGKAKKGSCMFIRDELYDKAKDFLYMGLEVPKTNAPIVELSAYVPLVSSTIVDKIKINPKNILILKDVETFMNTKVASVETDDDKHVLCNIIDDYKIKSTLFDGQAMIESSIFPSWANGCVLLRHHFCKMEAVKTNIQLFFKDYFGDKYDTATVEDMFGNKHLVKDIELITTNNSMKFLKFDISYDYWCEKVEENGSLFGIVKTAHKSKLGNVQKMSYQMINSLSMDIMPNVVETSKSYIENLKSDNDVFLEYLKMNQTFSNDYEVLIALVEQNREFLRSEYFRARKMEIIRSYVNTFKRGKVLQNADNLVIIGSPYAMLLHSVKESIYDDKTLVYEEGCYQCCTNRFKDNEYLAEFRSPFNGQNNLGYMHNLHSEKILKYFDLGTNIIAVNMIDTDFQARNSGSDMDGDVIFTTNQKDIVEYAKYCQKEFLTIENNIPQEKKVYNNTPYDYAKIDNELAGANLFIGQSSNICQLALTYMYNYDDIDYTSYVCMLNAISQVAIDNAKRKFDIDLESEINRIKNELDINTKKFPNFWCNINTDINKKKINKELKCPMNYLSEVKFKIFRNKESTLTMDYFFIRYEFKTNKYKNKKVERLIEKYNLKLKKSNINHDDRTISNLEFNELIENIKSIKLSNNYIDLMSWLIDRAFLITPFVLRKKNEIMSETNKNKALLLSLLYKMNNKALLKVFSKNIGD